MPPTTGGGGSSPHTRGAQRTVRAAVGPVRIIPAYAGSTFPFVSVRGFSPDHPRIRGEHFSIEKQRKKICGSSPHTRGALLGWALCRGLRRIIPAYAGSTDAADLSGQTVEDHPRIRGEHAPRRYEPPAGRGSSPHTRGARRPHERIARICRIIPAYAGSTWIIVTRQAPARDHPRIRGEHHHPCPNGLPGSGSSPHTRGAQRRRIGDQMRARIIPAYAGSTTSRG